MKKDQESAKTDIPESASISNPSRPFVRLRGSHSSQRPIVAIPNPLRRRDDDGDPFPNGDPLPPPPPPPLVSTPDLAIQLAFCLDQDMENGLISSVRDAIGPEADVRTACINNSQRIGIWLRPFVNQEDNQARNRGLEKINVIQAGETLAFFINSALIRRRAFDSFNAMPKRLNGDGDPDPDGPIHLTGFSVSFEGPNKIVTHINGFDERPWPDVDFELTITDTLSVSGGEPRCDSERDLDVDTSWLNFLTGLFLIVLPPLGVFFLVERIIIATRDAPDVDAGAGGSVPGIIPQEILIPAGLKVVASYSRLEVFPGAIVAGGTFNVIPRTPEVSISGPILIAVEEGATSLTRNYTLHTEDLRPPFYDVFAPNVAAIDTGPTLPRPMIKWSGDGVPLSPSAETTGFRFNISGGQAGQVLTRRVAVVVVDTDGLSGVAEVAVRIHITPEDDDFPPVCKVKPWLPQCQPQLERIVSSRSKASQPSLERQ